MFDQVEAGGKAGAARPPTDEFPRSIMVAPPMPFLPAEANGQLIIVALMAHAGPVEAGERAFARFRALATPLADLVRPMPYPEIFQLTQNEAGPDHEVAQSMFIGAVDHQAAEAIVDHLRASTAPLAIPAGPIGGTLHHGRWRNAPDAPVRQEGHYGGWPGMRRTGGDAMGLLANFRLALQRVREQGDQPCGHLDQIREVAPSSTGCQPCMDLGDRWVHLRMCMTDGQVLCCDSSKNQHASRHALEHAPTHQIARSMEPGEDWMWCYTDQIMVEPPPAEAVR